MIGAVPWTTSQSEAISEAVVIPHGLIIMAAIVLGCVAIALAWPVPIRLVRASWPARMPIMSLLLWQLVGLAGGFSMIGALALAGLACLPRHPWYAMIPAALFAAYLLTHLGVTIVHVTRQRHRHLALLQLLTSPHPTRTRTRVIDETTPVAYCLPYGMQSVTVLSQGLLDRLDPDELVAVIAHERAHVEQRHDLLLLAFRAWRAALPWFPIAARAEAEVAALVEMLADDYARREVKDVVLARAILAVGARGLSGSGRAEPASTRMGDRFRRLAG